MPEPNYSLTTWIVRPESKDEFVRRWTAFAEWSSAEGLAASAKLLRDVDDPKRFISFGPWESLEAIRRWRTLEGFQVHVAALSEVVEDFEPRPTRWSPSTSSDVRTVAQAGVLLPGASRVHPGWLFEFAQ